MLGVILAAGSSTRMGALTSDHPKCLLTIAGKTILERQLESLFKAGVDKVLIVSGYHSDRVERLVKEMAISEVELVKNHAYATTDNAYSLWLALRDVDASEEVIILDSDIIFEHLLLEELVNHEHGNVMVVDVRSPPVEEDCKVTYDDSGKVSALGKKVDGRAVYTSMIKLRGPFLQGFVSELSKDRESKEWYSEPLNRTMERLTGHMVVMENQKYYRCEVDTPEDYYARKDEIERYTNGL